MGVYMLFVFLLFIYFFCCTDKINLQQYDDICTTIKRYFWHISYLNSVLF